MSSSIDITEKKLKERVRMKSIWGLYEGGKPQPPLKYSNGKTQEDVVCEIVEAFESYDIVALQGGVGTGKSVIGIHTIAHIGGGRGIIVVPTKVLEDQYVSDYTGGKFRVVLNGEELKFASIMGRSNFVCPFAGGSASGSTLPCTRSLIEKTQRGFKRLRRVDVASICPYWSPIVSDDHVETYYKKLKNIRKHIIYESVAGRRHILVRDPCPYYAQYVAYAKRNIILMNSAIWEIETFSGRKPKTKIEVIDEADAWLDSLNFERRVSIKTIQKLIDHYSDDQYIAKLLDDLLVSLTELISRYADYVGEVTDEWLTFIAKYSETFDEIGRESSLGILPIIDKVWMSVDKNGARFFVPNLKAVFSKIRKRSGDKLLLMSATFPSRDILTDVFGIDNICFIEGETKFPGTIYLRKTGKEDYINHKRWRSEGFRKNYFSCLSDILTRAKRPLLVQVHSRKYLPSDKLEENLNDRRVFREDFDEAWSTVAKRGLDLKGDRCRAICILKHPFGDLSDGMLQAIRLKLGDDVFFKYYRDRADRELIQQVGRAVRSDDDWVEVWSPDLTVHDTLLRKWKGRIVKYGQLTI